jgi:hypothetical protein
VIKRFRRIIADWSLANLILQRCESVDKHLIRRRSDGTLWVAHHPQSFARAMQGVLTDKPRTRWHFIRVRDWHDMLVASPKTFWLPLDQSEFHLVSRTPYPVLMTEPLPEAVESARIDAIVGSVPAQPDPFELGRRIRLVRVDDA